MTVTLDRDFILEMGQYQFFKIDTISILLTEYGS